MNRLLKQLFATQVEVQTQTALWSDPIEPTPVCSQTEITGSGRRFERTRVWTMVWNWSGQRSIWSEKSDHRRIRAHLSLIINGSSATGSDRKRIREMLALPRGNNKAAFWSETHLKSDCSDQNKGDQLIAKAGPLQKIFWLAGDHDVSYGKLSKLIHWVRNIH